MRRDDLRLRPRLRATFYAVFAVLFASGAGWWVAHTWLLSADDGATASNAIEPWLLKVHGAAAMAALLVLGALYPVHIARSWRTRRNRGWGIGLVVACLVLILTGYLLYYAGGEIVRDAAASIHLWLGVALPIILGVHIWRGRATRSK